MKEAPVGRHVLAWGVVALVTMLSSSAIGQPAVTDLLERLNLSGYPDGIQPPTFSGRTAAGRRVVLAGLRGRVVLLNFWATSCLECQAEMPLIEQLHHDFAAKGLTVVGVNAYEDAPAIRDYAKELDLTFPLVMDPKGQINGLYRVVVHPTTFLIGRDGRIVALAIGGRDWSSPPARAIIQALLAEPAARKGAR
ncbi:MAG: peroxiredoxin family protein [Nitrospiraceae bacterium]